MSEREPSLSMMVYRKLKEAIFNFEILPGDRFTENSLAKQYDVSRTPVREALLNLEREAYVSSRFKGGWLVRELNFSTFEDLYDIRIMIEKSALTQIFHRKLHLDWVEAMKDVWLSKPEKRVTAGREVAKLDEAFHTELVKACGNIELNKIYSDVTDRIRIVRNIDFTETARISITYAEHGQILKNLAQNDFVSALTLLENHILSSRREVRSITMLRLHQARSQRFEE